MSPNRHIAHLRRRPFGWAAAMLLCLAAPAPAQTGTNTGAAPAHLVITNINAPLPGQTVTTNAPPIPPEKFNPDPGNPPFRTNLTVPEKIYEKSRVTNSSPPPKSATVFN